MYTYVSHIVITRYVYTYVYIYIYQICTCIHTYTYINIHIDALGKEGPFLAREHGSFCDDPMGSHVCIHVYTDMYVYTYT